MDLVGDFLSDSKEAPETIEDARQLLVQTFAEIKQIDGILARHARRWEMGRLALVDRNILRLAVRELQAGRTPMKVVIAEALKLAQEFSTAESPRFVNGVIDAVARELLGGSAEPPGETDKTEAS